MLPASARYGDSCHKCNNDELIDNDENFLVCTNCGDATPCISGPPPPVANNLDISYSATVPVSIQVLLLDIIANNNINYSLFDEAMKILHQIWPFFYKKHIKNESILAYCLYQAYNDQEMTISLSKAANFSKSSIKDLQKIITITKANGFSDINYPEDQVSTICSHLNIPPYQADIVKTHYINCIKTNCQSSPNAIIASIIYYLSLSTNQPPIVRPAFKNTQWPTLSEIAHCCDVTPNTVLKCYRKIKKLLH